MSSRPRQCEDPRSRRVSMNMNPSDERRHTSQYSHGVSVDDATTVTRSNLTQKLSKMYNKGDDEDEKNGDSDADDDCEDGGVVEDDGSSIEDQDDEDAKEDSKNETKDESKEDSKMDVSNSRNYYATGSTRRKNPVDFCYKVSRLTARRDVIWDVDVTAELTDVKLVAEGSNSHIFTAMWGRKEVIVKMLQYEKAENRVAIDEFTIECETLARLDHPNIIRMLGCGSKPRPFLILEKLKDMSHVLDLKSRPKLFRKIVFTYAELLLIAIDLADALGFLHQKMHPDVMIIHRDLKPENLGLTADGKIKLFDFGLSKCVRKRDSDDETYKMTGNTGSIRYMAPEVVLSQPYNEKVDVFSFAVVIWTIGCNKLPYRELDRVSHRARVVLRGERPKMERAWPKDFCDLMKACWHADYMKRPSFAEIKARLEPMAQRAAEDAVTSAASRASKFIRNMLFSR